MQPITDPVRKFLYDLGSNSAERIQNSISLLVSIITVVSYVASFWQTDSGGSSASASGGIVFVGIDGNLPLSLAVFLFVTVMMGWGLGFVIQFVAAHFDDLGLYIGHLLSIIWMCTIVGIAYSMFKTGRVDALPQGMLFAVVSVCIAITLARINVRRMLGLGHIEATRRAAGMIATFCGAAVCMTIVLQLSN